jgi:hypothetical protein
MRRKLMETTNFWEYSGPTALVNGALIQRPLRNPAVIDTDSALALVDDALCKKFHKALLDGVFNHFGF